MSFYAQNENNSFQLIIPHYYLHSNNMKTNCHQKIIRRIAKEIITLRSSLPLSLGSSVFVRQSEEHLDAIKVRSI